jgi:hypothetical protein
MLIGSTILFPLLRDRGSDKVTRKNAANGHVFSDFRKSSLLRADGDGQWKRWGCAMEAMEAASGKDRDGQWKRWGWPVEKMGMASGKDGDG